jgi:hypothetical protein
MKSSAQAMSSRKTQMDSTKKTCVRLLARISLSAALGVALSVLPPKPANAAPSCPATITACGCKITNSQIYTVANNLSAAQTTLPTCIEIAKDHAILNTMGFSLTGSGKGTGIVIDKGADHAIVEGTTETANGQSNVTQWNIGIEDDANDAIIQLFANIGNNSTTGVLVKQVTNSIVGDLLANSNGRFGIVVDHSSRVEIYNVATSGDGEVGLWLDSSNNNHILGTAGANILGTWLSTSSNNVVADDANINNSNTGLVVGCGLDRKNCPGNERSNNNYIVFGTASSNTKAGVVIRKHSGGNTVTLGTNNGNGGNKMDMVDENNKCGSNVWYNNTGQGNQSCIR